MPKQFKPLPSVQELRKQYRYDPATGNLDPIMEGAALTRVKDRRYGRDYYRARVYYPCFDLWAYMSALRVVWVLQTGKEPEGKIGTRDGDPLNLAWRNLTPKRIVHTEKVPPWLRRKRKREEAARLARDAKKDAARRAKKQATFTGE
jgi:hypothetical protein